MKIFEDWCALQGRQPFPAAPALVAQFVREWQPLGIDETWEVVCQISQAHNARGLADPTLSEPVTKAMNEIAQIEPPRSWPKREKERFLRLPYDLQLFFWMRDGRREKQIRRLMTELDLLRKEKATNGEAAAA